MRLTINKVRTLPPVLLSNMMYLSQSETSELLVVSVTGKQGEILLHTSFRDGIVPRGQTTTDAGGGVYTVDSSAQPSIYELPEATGSQEVRIITFINTNPTLFSLIMPPANSTLNGVSSSILIERPTAFLVIDSDPNQWTATAVNCEECTDGIDGRDGRDGERGCRGLRGESGLDGLEGGDGPQGLPGKDGLDGRRGERGDRGLQGVSGLAGGERGPQGLPGLQGNTGNRGERGVPGPQGANGSQGAAGSQGASGADGSQGAAGSQGATGISGTNGTNGTNGTQGATGLMGSVGPVGATGVNGSSGPQGPAGPVGPAGGFAVRYEHIQTTASTVWTIPHNLNTFPPITVLSPTGQLLYADVQYVDSNNITVTHTSAESGKCYL